MGKSKKKSHKPKFEDTNQEKRYLLHMDLCGPMRVKSVNKKKYILIIVNDYSRFTWVKCLRSKDEAPDFIIKFLKMIQVRLKVPVRRIRTDNGTEFVNQTLREYYEQRLWLPHVTPKIDPLYDLVTIFIGYALTKKAFWIYNRRTRRIVETIHIDFGELTAMASEQSSSGPVLHEMTPTTISSGLVPKPTSSTLFVPPTRNEWDLLFQLLFDELVTPPPSVDPPASEVIAPVFLQYTLNQPFHLPQQQLTKMHHHRVNLKQHQKLNLLKWTKDYPLDNIIGQLSRPVSTRLQPHEQALFYYYDAFLTSVEPKTYKDALTQSYWIEAMQEELNEFEWLETAFLNGNLWEEVYVSQLDGFVDPDNPNHVYKLKKALYGLKQAPHVWYDMLSSFLISQDFTKGSVDPTLFIRRNGNDLLLDSLIALTAFADAGHVGYQDTRRSTSGSLQFLGDRLIS
uniref:Retrovirus-related Pol polyprotein from transposon TNT 1-94 n=1 Tax=Tanacetum cinerariifolium TaxID=118510 RepID=A0A699GT37_TANCI|nr:retrovirus-related Pol polyprotein from transposon TNT 1-94 [Tanacetum cinerariifolium]